MIFKIKRKNLPDTSSELILQRHNEGIKLKKPTNLSQLQDTHSIKEIFNLPFNVYFDSFDHIAVNLNEMSAKICGCDSVQEIIGRSGLDFFEKEAALRGEQNQIEVMQTAKVKILKDTLIRRKDDIPYSYLCISYPWYSEDNKIIGVFGCSFSQVQSAESLMKLYELGLLTKPSKQFELPLSFSKQFTLREYQCIELIMQGRATKEIAHILSLSPRTVEHYIENIKDKMNVKTKAALMIKIGQKEVI